MTAAHQLPQVPQDSSSHSPVSRFRGPLPTVVRLEDVLASPLAWEQAAARWRRWIEGAFAPGSKASFRQDSLSAADLGYQIKVLKQIEEWIENGHEVLLSVHPRNEAMGRDIARYLRVGTVVTPQRDLSASVAVSPVVPRLTKRAAILVVLRALRPHQWTKNLLVFVPFLAAHSFASLAGWLAACAAFVGFSLTASAVYVLNDMVDAPTDRKHPDKRSRAFAAGDLSLRQGVLLFVGLLGLAAAVAAQLPERFGVIVALYLAGNLLYSFGLKKVPSLDLVLLAAMYTARLMAGGAATSTPVSSWLASFAVFFFFGLAALKRYVDLRQGRSDRTAGRGYTAADAESVFSLGAGASLMSSLVLALYLSSPQAGRLYNDPDNLWLLMAVLLFWSGRLWTAARRGEVHADPVVFVLRDRQLWLAALAGGLVFWLAS